MSAIKKTMNCYINHSKNSKQKIDILDTHSLEYIYKIQIMAGLPAFVEWYLSDFQIPNGGQGYFLFSCIKYSFLLAFFYSGTQALRKLIIC